MIPRSMLRTLPIVALAVIGVLLVHSIQDPHRPMAHLPWALAWPRAIRCDLGLALLGLAWIWVLRRTSTSTGPTLGEVLLLAVPVHLVTLQYATFLTNDCMYYMAIGRTIARGHSIFGQLIINAPADHVPQHVDGHYSAYLPGFHLLCWIVALIGKESLFLSMRLYQLVAALAMFATAGLTGLTARRASLAGTLSASFVGSVEGVDPTARSERAAAKAAALVIFSPLAIIEATGNGHNDALMALSIAVFAACLASGRTIAAVAGLAIGLSIKISGILPMGIFLGALLIAPIHKRLSSRAAAALFVTVAVLGAVGVWLMLPTLAPYSRLFQHGRALACTFRSLECPVQRWLLNAGRFDESWAVGLAVRAAGAVFVLYAIWRICRDARPLARIGVALFVLYLYAAGQSWSWYFLSVLPLACFAPPGYYRAILAGLLAYPLSYAGSILFGALPGRYVGWQMTMELVIVNAPPTFFLIWDHVRHLRGGSASVVTHARA